MAVKSRYDPFDGQQQAHGNRSGAEAVKRMQGVGKFHGSAQSIVPLSDDEWEFAQAMRVYSDATHHRFPTYSECLHVLRGLGYRKL